MKRKAESIFKPTPSKAETKGDRTSETARTILKVEATHRNAKTERLRAARLAREAAEPPAPVAPKARKTKAK